MEGVPFQDFLKFLEMGALFFEILEIGSLFFEMGALFFEILEIGGPFF